MNLFYFLKLKGKKEGVCNMQKIDIEIQQICKKFIDDFDRLEKANMHPYEATHFPESENNAQLFSVFMKVRPPYENPEVAFVEFARELAIGNILFTETMEKSGKKLSNKKSGSIVCKK
jgi:hypothetical protein